MKDSLVSVSVVTYQHVSYIKECLDSILMQQTDFPFEILLGEDESTDGTREVCIEYANKHPDKIRLFLRSRADVIYINGNPTGRYNFLENLKAAHGKYIAICEGDDYWTDPNKLQKQVDFLEANEDYAICYHRVYELPDGKDPELSNLNTSLQEETYTIEDLAKGNFIHTPSVVFRNGLIKEYPEWLNKSPVGDYVLHMLNAKHGKIKYLPEAMAIYRRHANGVWSGKSQLYQSTGWVSMLEHLTAEFKNTQVEKILLQQKTENDILIAKFHKQVEIEKKPEIEAKTLRPYLFDRLKKFKCFIRSHIEK